MGLMTEGALKNAAIVLGHEIHESNKDFQFFQDNEGNLVGLEIKGKQTSAQILDTSSNFGDRVHLLETNATQSKWYSINDLSGTLVVLK